MRLFLCANALFVATCLTALERFLDWNSEITVLQDRSVEVTERMTVAVTGDR